MWRPPPWWLTVSAIVHSASPHLWVFLCFQDVLSCLLEPPSEVNVDSAVERLKYLGALDSEGVRKCLHEKVWKISQVKY